MRAIRKLVLVAALMSIVAALVSSAGVASASPTHAAPAVRPNSLSMCAGGEFCFWANSGYGGDEAAIPANTNVPNLSSFGMYKRASSLYNKTNYAADVYANANYVSSGFGSVICVESGVTISNLGTFNPSFSFNDKAVSIKFIGRKCPA